MSVLKKKRVLYIGNNDNKSKDISDLLDKHKISLQLIPCSQFSLSQVYDYDLIILNRTAGDNECAEILEILDAEKINFKIPIFLILNHDDLVKLDILNCHITDYVLGSDDNLVLLQKINDVLYPEHTFSGNSEIDITPQVPKLTKKNIKVFVIEDDPLLRSLFTTLFKKFSFHYEFCTNAELALPFMRSFAPQVIILDLVLPGKSGLDLLAEIKDDVILKAIPVVVFSNRDNQEDKTRAENLQAAAFRIKAMTDLSELAELIESLVKSD